MKALSLFLVVPALLLMAGCSNLVDVKEPTLTTLCSDDIPGLCETFSQTKVINKILTKTHGL